MTARLRGVCSAALTPFDTEFRPDSALAIAYYERLLQSGCDALNLMGTTGEAMSIATADRLQFMEDIARSGLPLERLMVGTGAASLRDAIRLTRAALELGFAAALVMPPFFYRGIYDDGVVAFFERFFDGVRPPEQRILLYNFPAMSGITFHADLVDRLLDEHPGLIAGMKDSSNDVTLQSEILARHPGVLMYPGSELSLADARKRGAAGCISASVALWPQLAAAVWRGEVPQEELTRRRGSLAGLPTVPAVRYLLARQTAQPQWERCIPPQMPLTKTQSSTLTARFEGIGVS
ncbi:MAG TPA: dihydrodipicolinate synthase family protein [Candidatus Baltobacteraceae bacterium]|nr:dihydrodipicolinate synthase family protein [Candidatus Baltobacteraceae bacterium]